MNQGKEDGASLNVSEKAEMPPVMPKQLAWLDRLMEVRSHKSDESSGTSAAKGAPPVTAASQPGECVELWVRSGVSTS